MRSERETTLRAGKIDLPALVGAPDAPRGVVLFAHGSGSGRLSARNRAVAAHLRGGGLATVLFDLLTPEESAGREGVFNIPLLASRLRGASEWVSAQDDLGALARGYFGASTGAAAALVAAAEDESIRAIVSRGGRPDLAEDALDRVRAPTLLIVGGEDRACIPLNERAAERLRCEHELVIVEGATHLFEEAGALDRVAECARAWFERHLAGRTG